MSSSSPACCLWGQRTSTLWEHCLALMAQLPPGLHVSDTPVPNTRGVPLHAAAEDVQCVTPSGSIPSPSCSGLSVSPVSIGIQMGQPCPTPRCPLATEGPRAVRPQGWATAGGGLSRVAEQRSCCSSLGPLSLHWLDWHWQMVPPFAGWQLVNTRAQQCLV